MKPEKIEDVERAAWYARLAFGVCPDQEVVAPINQEKAEAVFQVMP